MKLFWMTFRTWHVERALIEAPDLDRADTLGRAWCSSRNPRVAFVGVEPAVVANFDEFFSKDHLRTIKRDAHREDL